MSPSTSSLCLITFSLFTISILGADPLFHICSTSNNFTNHDPYASNLDWLLDYLSHSTPLTGFGLGALGQNQNQVHGLALCRGDVSTNECKTCVNEGKLAIRYRCPYNKGAIIWYDKCLVKYLNRKFFGQIDEQSKFYLWNVKNGSDPLEFNQMVREILSHLSDEASVSPRMYAAGELELGNGDIEKIYGLAQCTRDLSSSECKMCIDNAIGEVLRCCDGKQGGRVVGGSCNVRYELYPFFS